MTTNERDVHTDHDSDIMEQLAQAKANVRYLRKELDRMQKAFHAKRDEAELWRYRAQRNLDRLRTERIKNSKTEGNK